MTLEIHHHLSRDLSQTINMGTQPKTTMGTQPKTTMGTDRLTILIYIIMTRLDH